MSETTPETAPDVPQDAMAKMTDAILNEGYTPHQFTPLSDRHLEAVYALAYRKFNQQQYAEAETLFKWLCGLNHYDTRFMLGLGAAYQKQRKYSNALDAYSAAGVMDLKNPIPPLRAAECHMAMGAAEKAAGGCRTCIRFSGDDPQHQRWKARAELILKGVEARQKKRDRLRKEARNNGK